MCKLNHSFFLSNLEIPGNWLIEGNPTVVLFDIGSAAGNLNSWKQELYENTHIGPRF